MEKNNGFSRFFAFFGMPDGIDFYSPTPYNRGGPLCLDIFNQECFLVISGGYT